MCDRQLLFINITLKRFADGFVLERKCQTINNMHRYSSFMLMEVWEPKTKCRPNNKGKQLTNFQYKNEWVCLRPPTTKQPNKLRDIPKMRIFLSFLFHSKGFHWLDYHLKHFYVHICDCEHTLKLKHLWRHIKWSKLSYRFGFELSVRNRACQIKNHKNGNKSTDTPQKLHKLLWTAAYKSHVENSYQTLWARE